MTALTLTGGTNTIDGSYRLHTIDTKYQVVDMDTTYVGLDELVYTVNENAYEIGDDGKGRIVSYLGVPANTPDDKFTSHCWRKQGENITIKELGLSDTATLINLADANYPTLASSVGLIPSPSTIYMAA